MTPHQRLLMMIDRMDVRDDPRDGLRAIVEHQGQLEARIKTLEDAANAQETKDPT